MSLSTEKGACDIKMVPIQIGDDIEKSVVLLQNLTQAKLIWLPENDTSRAAEIVKQMFESGVKYIVVEYLGFDHYAVPETLRLVCNRVRWYLSDEWSRTTCQGDSADDKKNLLRSKVEAGGVRCSEDEARKPRHNREKCLASSSAMACQSFVLAVVQLDPYFNFEITNFGGVHIGGLEGLLIRTLQEKFKFRMQVMSPTDRQWGVFGPNNSWTGIVGMLHRKEADFGVSGLTCTYKRSKVIDFSTAYAMQTWYLISKIPAKQPRRGDIYRPLSNEVWMSIFISILCCFCIFYIIGKTSRKTSPTPIVRIFWFLATSLNSHGFRKADFQGRPALFLLTSWFWFVFILRATYNANIISLLTVTGTESPIKTFADVADRIQRENYDIAALKGTTAIEFLSSLTDELKPISDRVRSAPYSAAVSTEEGIIRAVTGKCVFLSPKRPAIFTAKILDVDKNIYIGDGFGAGGVHIFYRKNFPFQKKFNTIIQRLFEMGIVDYWDKKIVQRPSTHVFWNRSNNFTFTEDIREDTQYRQLTFNELKGIFILLPLGFVTSTFAFIMEITCSYWSKRCCSPRVPSFTHPIEKIYFG